MEILRQALPLLSGPLQILLLALSAVLARKIHSWVRNKELADMLSTLEGYALRSVSEVYQGFVEPLKNPSKPGAWTEQAAASAKAMAVSRIRILAPTLVAALAAAGEDTNQTLGQMVEKAVLEINSRLKATP